jgi:hypothetical protein
VLRAHWQGATSRDGARVGRRPRRDVVVRVHDVLPPASRGCAVMCGAGEIKRN